MPKISHLSYRAQEFWRGYFAAKCGCIPRSWESPAWRDGFSTFKQRDAGVA